AQRSDLGCCRLADRICTQRPRPSRHRLCHRGVGGQRTKLTIPVQLKDKFSSKRAESRAHTLLYLVTRITIETIRIELFGERSWQPCSFFPSGRNDDRRTRHPFGARRRAPGLLVRRDCRTLLPHARRGICVPVFRSTLGQRPAWL